VYSGRWKVDRDEQEEHIFAALERGFCCVDKGVCVPVRTAVVDDESTRTGTLRLRHVWRNLGLKKNCGDNMET